MLTFIVVFLLLVGTLLYIHVVASQDVLININFSLFLKGSVPSTVTMVFFVSVHLRS